MGSWINFPFLSNTFPKTKWLKSQVPWVRVQAVYLGFSSGNHGLQSSYQVDCGLMRDSTGEQSASKLPQLSAKLSSLGFQNWDPSPLPVLDQTLLSTHSSWPWGTPHRPSKLTLLSQEGSTSFCMDWQTLKCCHRSAFANCLCVRSRSQVSLPLMEGVLYRLQTQSLL